MNGRTDIMAIKKKFPYKAAFVACNGGCRQNEDAPQCLDGCIGCTMCIALCRFDAIHLNEYGVAQVDEDKCVACGMCVKGCPQGVIHIRDCSAPIVVKCSNQRRGAEAKKECQVSCIGCGICERVCPASAIRVVDNCARIDESRCLGCGMCAVNCPRGAIYDLKGILAPIR